MGSVKEFGVWLSACVYQWKMSDEEIINRFKLRADAKKKANIESWLKAQIKIVRNNPEQFREMLGWQRGKDF